MEVGAAAGFWQATTLLGNGRSENRSAAFVLPRLGFVVTDPLGAGWWRGNVEVLAEPLFARFTQPFAAEAAGGSLVLKYNFLSFGRWMPFWDAGAGMIWTNLAPRVQEQSTQLEFVLETGPGVHYFMTDTVTLTMGVRLHHISNGGLGDRNTGINAVLPYVGLSCSRLADDRYLYDGKEIGMACERCNGFRTKERLYDFLENGGQIYVSGWRWVSRCGAYGNVADWVIDQNRPMVNTEGIVAT